MEWISAKNPPKEGNRYWCHIKEATENGPSYFQWNCYYDVEQNEWRDNHQVYNVTHWVPLLPRPKNI